MRINRQQLEDLGENWYQRTKRLVSYYQDDSKPIEKRMKAFRLSMDMTKRVQHVASEMFKRSQPKINKFKKGCV